MPLRLDPTLQRNSYVYIVRTYSTAIERTWSQLHAYEGIINHIELAALVMAHCRGEVWQHPDIYYTLCWEGHTEKLEAITAMRLSSACARCGVRGSNGYLKKCCKCHFMRYGSTACSIEDWGRGHNHAVCQSLRGVFDRHTVRRSGCQIHYGYVRRYELTIWEHDFNKYSTEGAL